MNLLFPIDTPGLIGVRRMVYDKTHAVFKFDEMCLFFRNIMKVKMPAQAKDITVGSGVGSMGVAVIANNGSSEPSNPGIFQLSMPANVEEVV